RRSRSAGSVDTPVPQCTPPLTTHGAGGAKAQTLSRRRAGSRASRTFSSTSSRPAPFTVRVDSPQHRAHTRSVGRPASVSEAGRPSRAGCQRVLPDGLSARPPGRAASASSRRPARVARSKGLAQPSALSPLPSVLYANLPDPLPSASWQLLAGTAYDPSMSTTDDDRSRLAAESPDFLAGSLADDAPEDPCVLVDVWQDDAFIRRSEH